MFENDQTCYMHIEQLCEYCGLHRRQCCVSCFNKMIDTAKIILPQLKDRWTLNQNVIFCSVNE